MNPSFRIIIARALALTVLALPCQAQRAGGRILDTNVNSWFVYAGDHQIKGPWGVYSEMQVRRSDIVAIWQQFQVRDAVTYRFSPRVQAAVGYVFTNTLPYGDFPAARSFTEQRTYQQIALKHGVGALELEHRFRTEQRWIQNFTGATDYFWRYQNRVRYQARVVLPITKTDSAGHQWYLFGGNEILVQYGPNRGPNRFDQTRPFAGVGYKLTRNNKVEVGYLNQYIIQRNDRIIESDHTFRVQWSSSTPLGKLFR